MPFEDQVWMHAKLCAAESTCVRRKVGAVVTGSAKNLLAFGHNVERHGLRCDRGECPRGTKTYDEVPASAPHNDCVAVHAEVDVLSDLLAHDLSACTLWVTSYPCSECWEVLDRYPGMTVRVLGKGTFKAGEPRSEDLHQRPDQRA